MESGPLLNLISLKQREVPPLVKGISAELMVEVDPLFSERAFYLLSGKYQGSPRSGDVTPPFIVPSLQTCRPVALKPVPCCGWPFPSARTEDENPVIC